MPRLDGRGYRLHWASRAIHGGADRRNATTTPMQQAEMERPRASLSSGASACIESVNFTCTVLLQHTASVLAKRCVASLLPS